MPSMFPGFHRDPRDLNRQYRPSQRDLMGVPRTISWGYWLLVIIAILMVVTGLILMTTQPPANVAADTAMVQSVRRNLVFVGAFNLVAGILIAALAPQLRKGGKTSRRWLLGVIVVSALANLLSFVIMREPFSLALITAMLMIGGLVIFQPSATGYMDRVNE